MLDALFNPKTHSQSHRGAGVKLALIALIATGLVATEPSRSSPWTDAGAGPAVAGSNLPVHAAIGSYPAARCPPIAVTRNRWPLGSRPEADTSEATRPRRDNRQRAAPFARAYRDRQAGQIPPRETARHARARARRGTRSDVPEGPKLGDPDDAGGPGGDPTQWAVYSRWTAQTCRSHSSSVQRGGPPPGSRLPS